MHQPTQCHLWTIEKLRPEDIRESLRCLETWTNESHVSKSLCRCKDCGELYVEVWYEVIDWAQGNDEMFTVYIPVKNAQEIELVKKALPPPMSLDLLALSPRINRYWHGGTEMVAWVGRN